MLQFGASLTYATSSVNYNRNMFIIQATELMTQAPVDENSKDCCFVNSNPAILCLAEHKLSSFLFIQMNLSLHASADLSLFSKVGPTWKEFVKC